MSLARRSVQVRRHAPAARHGARVRGPDHRTGQRHRPRCNHLPAPRPTPDLVSCGYRPLVNVLAEPAGTGVGDPAGARAVTIAG
jgi:hypothetical protein